MEADDEEIEDDDNKKSKLAGYMVNYCKNNRKIKANAEEKERVSKLENSLSK